MTTHPKVQAAPLNKTLLEAATGRWGEVASDVVAVEPYVVTDGLVISPMTRRRRKKLRATQSAYMLAAARLAEVVKQETDPDPIVHEDTLEDGTVVRTITNPRPKGDNDQDMINRIQTLTDEAEAAYDTALFGDVYDDVMAFFEDQPDEYWDAFYTDVHNRLVHRIAPPENECTKCGRPFEEEAGEEGKGQSSSTSSKGTGTKLKAISGTT